MINEEIYLFHTYTFHQLSLFRFFITDSAFNFSGAHAGRLEQYPWTQGFWNNLLKFGAKSTAFPLLFRELWTAKLWLHLLLPWFIFSQSNNFTAFNLHWNNELRSSEALASWSGLHLGGQLWCCLLLADSGMVWIIPTVVSSYTHALFRRHGMSYFYIRTRSQLNLVACSRVVFVLADCVYCLYAIACCISPPMPAQGIN